MQNDTVVKIAELAVELKRSVSSIRNDVRAGFLPKPIKTGIRSVGFLRSEINAFLAERAAARTLTPESEGAR